MTVILEPWEVARASQFVADTKRVLTEGTSGGEVLPPTVTTEQIAGTDDSMIRRAAYGLFPSLAIVEPWAPVNFENSWTDYDPVGYEPAAYYMDPFGRVWIRGFVKRTVAGFASIAIFLLPNRLCPKYVVVRSTDGNNKHARLEVWPDGRVMCVAADSATPETFLSISLSFDTRI